MLQETTDPEVRDRYRATVIQPRRQRLAAVFLAAQQLGLIDVDADLTVAVTMCTGNWYGRALAGDPVPQDWPQRTAELVWRALGGRPRP
jgi:Tetracyclin repressor-like, C-terminal domain